MTRLQLGSPVQSGRKRLTVVFATTMSYMLAEAVGGVLTGSLDQANSESVLKSLLLEREFGIEHTALQLENAKFSQGASRTV